MAFLKLLKDSLSSIKKGGVKETIPDSALVKRLQNQGLASKDIASKLGVKKELIPQQTFKIGENLDRGTVVKPFAYKETADILKTLPKDEPVTTSLEPRKLKLSPFVKAKQSISYKPKTPIPERVNFKVPFIPKKVEFAPAGGLARGVQEVTSGLIEWPERMAKTLYQIGTQGKNLTPEVKFNKKGKEVPTVRTTIDEFKTNITTDPYFRKHPVQAYSLAVFSGMFDIIPEAQILEGSVKKQLSKLPKSIKEVENAKLAMGFSPTEKVTSEALKKAYARTAKIVHPDVGGTVESFGKLTKVNNLLKKELARKGGVINPVSKLDKTKRSIVETLDKDVKNLFKTQEKAPFLGVKGILPEQAGTIPTKPFQPIRQPNFGLSIREVPSKPVKLKLAKSLKKDPLKKEAKKYKSAEEFINNQPTYYHGTGEEFDIPKSMRQLRKEGKDIEASNIGGDSPFFHLSEQSTQAKGYATNRMKNIRGVPQIKEFKIDGNLLDLTKHPSEYNTKEKEVLFKIGNDLIEKSGNRGPDAFIGGELRYLGKPRTDYTEIKNANLSFNDIERSNELIKKLEEYGYSGFKFKDRTTVGGYVDSIAAIPEKVKTKSQLTDIFNQANNIGSNPKKFKVNIDRGIKVDKVNNEILNKNTFVVDHGYPRAMVNGKLTYLHDLVMGVSKEKGFDIDHINGDKLDNRVENLRIISHKGNTSNTVLSKANTSGYKGVHFNKEINKWVARISPDGKTTHLGSFAKIEDAIKARKEAEVKYFEPLWNKAQEKPITKPIPQAKKQAPKPVKVEKGEYTPEQIKAIEKQEIAKALEDYDEPFYDGEIENQYESFVNVMDKLKPFYKLREKIDAGDVDTFKKIVKDKNLIDRGEDMFRSDEMSDSDLFDKFKKRLMKEEPELLSTKRVVKELGVLQKEDVAEVRKIKPQVLNKIIKTEKEPKQIVSKIDELEEITTRKIKQTKEYQDWSKYAEDNLQDKDIRPSLLPRHSSMTAERVAEFFDGGIGGTMYNRMIKPVYDSVVKLKKEGNQIRNKVKSYNILEGSNDDINASLYAQGQLKNAPDKVKNFAKESRNLYDDLLVRLNDTRAKLGVEPIPKRKDYVTHLREMNVLSEVFGGMERVSTKKRISQIKNELLDKDPNLSPTVAFERAKRKVEGSSGIAQYIDARQPIFNFAKKRLSEYEANPSLVNSLNSYVPSALRYIYQAENVSKNKAFKDVLPPNAREFMRLWNTEQVAGRTPTLFIPNSAKGAITSLRNTLGANTILGNMATSMMQLTSFPQVVAFAGARNTATGIAKRISSYLSDSTGMYKYSRTKATRSLDTDIGLGDSLIDDMLKKISRYDMARTPAVKTRQAVDFGRNMLRGLMEGFDQFTTGATFEAFYTKAIKDGLEPTKAMEYADIMTGKTQANYFQEAISPFLNTLEGKTIGQFGTYGMNQWEMFKRDFGKDFKFNEVVPKSKRAFFNQFMKFLIGAYMVDSVSDKTFGRQPFDVKDLVDTGINVVKGDKKKIELAKQAKDTALSYIPFLSSVKFGSLPPVFEFGKDVIQATLGEGAEQKKAIKNMIEKWSLFILLPYGGNQVRKSLQGIEASDLADVPVISDVSKTSAGKTKFKIEGLIDKMKAVLFGAYATKGAREYYEPETKKKSETPKLKLNTQKLNIKKLDIKPTKLKLNKLKLRTPN